MCKPFIRKSNIRHTLCKKIWFAGINPSGGGKQARGEQRSCISGVISLSQIRSPASSPSPWRLWVPLWGVFVQIDLAKLATWGLTN